MNFRFVVAELLCFTSTADISLRLVFSSFHCHDCMVLVLELQTDANFSWQFAWTSTSFFLDGNAGCLNRQTSFLYSLGTSRCFLSF